MVKELFTAERGGGAHLNGEPVQVSAVTDPAEAMVVLGFMKSEATMRAGLAAMEKAIFRVRKVRCTGSAALDLAYVAAGRFTAYYEAGIHHWDIAAGRLLLQEAGGRFESRAAGADAINVFASNGGVHEALAPCFPL
jgi:myo-inositol-1(or 4)-monophosphatase